MHPIEQKVNSFLEAICAGKESVSESLIEEFGERCKTILRESFIEKETEDRTFRLRMSNIGKDLRSLMLDRDNPATYKPNKEFKLKSTIGHIYEAFMLTLLKASQAGLQDQDVAVELPVGKITILGTYDVKINDKIYDIKTSSPYAYENKFCSLEALRDNDAFGYFAQGFGYALAAGKDFGGWIAINKATGEFKVLEIPEDVHKTLQDYYLNEIKYKVHHITNNLPIPPCEGVIDEYFRKKPTGNKILNRNCEWCSHKNKCHPNLQALPETFSEARERKTRYYIGQVKYPKKDA